MLHRSIGFASLSLLFLLPGPNTIQTAVERSLPLLQKTDATFMKKAACVSCHHNSLTAMTVSLARRNGFAVDEQIASQQLKAVAKYAEDSRDRISQGIGIPGFQDTISYILLGLGAENHEPDKSTAVMAAFLKDKQTPEGRWPIRARRPPMEASDITVTATSLHALQLYAPAGDKLEYNLAVMKAADWLAAASPKNNEEHALRLLGLTWAGNKKAVVEQAIRDVAAEQRIDGGWAQLPTMQSDAYATGQTLVALREAGVSQKDRVYLRGVQFLLETQLEDGSWFVKTRSAPIQPYFESDFPHGDHQWISVAATNWATMALIHAR
jgi:squalene cyclase